ncbi:bacterio-opsin activator domain-containing protein [Halobacterium zhouii]|uniref:bacterio-opsin activator domain-containing protein n=1 Tax=Halobacterium zhouii TaxID=2902624 RepID=UPI001E613E04|nr:bacterio-opsin activator domain-containing protein [Halobacterium zhouii]
MQTRPSRPRVLCAGSGSLARALTDAFAEFDCDADHATEAASARDALGAEFDLVVATPSLHDPASFVGRAAADSTVVVYDAGGDGALASRVLDAGATDYVTVADFGGETGTPDVERALAALETRALDHGEPASQADTPDTRSRAQWFDAIFRDDETYAWVLDSDGRVTRRNDAASRLSGADHRHAPLAALPHWADGDAEAVGELVDRALAGESASAEVTAVRPDDEDVTLSLSLRPVEDAAGGPAGAVAQAADITERVRLEEELRASEELHRVTLNNMTDTVLMTDEDGEFTYVCPNVHFIFGYDAAQIHEMDGVEELLGENLYDPDRLDEEGVLTNIECRATDEAGEEHVLLINVREVSIQDGTVLYSCRDVTKRKRREEALTALQGTARDLLYAESVGEVAHVVAGDAQDILGADATAVYEFDEETNALDPVAAEPDRLRGERVVRPVGATADNPVRRAFIDSTTRHVTGPDAVADALAPTTSLAALAAVPLGSHGVFLAGFEDASGNRTRSDDGEGRSPSGNRTWSDDADAFDEVTEELVDVVASTAEAALDRLEREATLHSKERELHAQNERLTQANRANAIIREIGQALVRAETRSEIEAAVCERLTADDRFAFAWVGSRPPKGEVVEPRAWAGDGDGYLDEVSFGVDASRTDPAGVTAATGAATTVERVRDGFRSVPWRRAAFSRGFQSAVSVPLAYDEFAYGVLTVYATRPNAFEGDVASVLAELGEMVASAVSATERKAALLTQSGTRLRFEVADGQFTAVRLARAADCRVVFEGGIARTDDGTDVFVTVSGRPATEVAAAVRELAFVSQATVMTERADGGVLRVGVTGSLLAVQLANHGAVVQRIVADASDATAVVDVPGGVGVQRTIGVVLDRFGDAELVARTEHTDGTLADLRSTLLERLTDRQVEVLQTAYYSGFFESPRERTGEEVAETLDISPAAFYEHNRAVQRTLFGALFGDAET